MGELRKHYSNMSRLELWYLNNRIKQIKKYSLSEHALERMEEKAITNDEVYNTLKDFKIIEYHRKHNGDRVLIRSKQGVFCICIVLDLDTNGIITTYKNYNVDNHYTIDMSKYDNFDILDYILNKTEYNKVIL